MQCSTKVKQNRPNASRRLRVAANGLDGDFAAAAPNQKWAGDITYIWSQKAEGAIFQHINGFYNTRRRRSYLGGISPPAFNAKVA